MQLSVASIYFSKGSIVDNVQTEGGASCKEMMRAASLHATAGHGVLKPGTGAAQAPLFQQSLRDYPPLWLGGNEYPPDSLLMMLRTLQTASPVLSRWCCLPFPRIQLVP